MVYEEQLPCGVIEDILCGYAEGNLFGAGGKADVVKEELLDGVFGEHGDIKTRGKSLGKGTFARSGDAGDEDAVHGWCAPWCGGGRVKTLFYIWLRLLIVQDSVGAVVLPVRIRVANSSMEVKGASLPA